MSDETKTAAQALADDGLARDVERAPKVGAQAIDIERTLDVAADAAGYARNALRAQKATIESQAAEIERLRAKVARAAEACDEIEDVAARVVRAALDDAGAAGEDGGEHG